MNKKHWDYWANFKNELISEIDGCYKNNLDKSCALNICCAIDALAGFMLGVNRTMGAEWRFQQFFKQYFPHLKRVFRDRSDPTKKISFIKLFYKSFRSGLVHEGDFGIGTGITRENTDPPILFSTWDDERYSIICINALRQDFLKALNNYERDLKKILFLAMELNIKIIL